MVLYWILEKQVFNVQTDILFRNWCMSSTYAETWILWRSSIFLKFVVFKNSQFHPENCILRVLLFVTFAFVLFLKMLTAAHTSFTHNGMMYGADIFWEKICQLILWSSRLLVFQTSGLPDFWSSRILDIWTSVLPNFWPSRFLVFRMSGLPDFQTSGPLDF